ncbi:MAG: hypothetical protein LLF76_00840 [Planctomycetaceae bacterium]|nr:hypothetical protein [Planctomycetaceae bacterium]
MKKQSLLALSVILINSFCGITLAVDWTDGGGSHLWSDPNNWSPYMPDEMEAALINKTEPNQCIINEGTDALAGITQVGWWTEGHLDVQGGVLNTGQIRVGSEGGGVGLMTMSGGNVTMASDSVIGQVTATGTLEITGGTMTQTGGWFYVGYGAGSTGTVSLKGGTLSIFFLQLDNGGTPLVDIEAGTLIIRDPRPDDISYQIMSYYAAPSRNWVTAYGGRGTLVCTAEPGTNYTIVTAVPPPPCDPIPLYDFNDDCEVNVVDLAMFATEWLVCNRTDGSCP